LNALFNFAVSAGWRGENPAAKLRRPKLDEVEIPILSPQEAKKLLTEARRPAYADIFPALVIQLFTGPRRSELPHIQWSWIRDRYLRLEKTKIRKKRAVEMDDALLAWLAPLRAREGRIFAPEEVEFNPDDTRNIEDAYTYRLSQIAAAAGVALPKNVLRHTAITYRDALTGDLAGTAAWAGNSPGMIENHYRGAATRDDALKFYALTPANV
jgi:site-specific recombinase XerD